METRIATGLYPIENNPVPEGAVVGAIETEDGMALRCARWEAAGPVCRGTVGIFLGCPSFVEHSFGAVEDLRARGFAVATFDWRSQGGSQRSLADTTKVHVRSFDEYQLDLQAFVSQGLLRDCPPPYYAVAQSVGAAILLEGMDRGLSCFERVVVQSPTLFSYKRYPKWYVTTVGQALRALGLGSVALRSTWHINQSAAWLTADPALRDHYWAISRSHPSLISKSRTAAWSVSYNRAHTRWVGRDFGATIRTPVLFTIGDKDPVIELPAVKAMASRIPGASLVEIPGGRHNPFADVDAFRLAFWRAFDDFVGTARRDLGSANPRALRA